MVLFDPGRWKADEYGADLEWRRRQKVQKRDPWRAQLEAEIADLKRSRGPRLLHHLSLRLGALLLLSFLLFLLFEIL